MKKKMTMIILMVAIILSLSFSIAFAYNIGIELNHTHQIVEHVEDQYYESYNSEKHYIKQGVIQECSIYGCNYHKEFTRTIGLFSHRPDLGGICIDCGCDMTIPD